jgi:hypothetical protein
MKKLNSKQIKKALLGITLTDGSCIGQRFSIYLKNEEFVNDINFILNNISGISKIHKKEIIDTRFNPPAVGYKLWTTNHIYFGKLNKIFYENGRKRINKYIADRLDETAFAYAWMCDGYLEHQKNRKANKIQNRGWFCLESFPEEELNLIVDRLKHYNIKSQISPVEWGYGYRIQISGLNLQRFIDMIYPYVLNSFKYKTIMYYKSTSSKYVLDDLFNTEHIIKQYNNVDDIVRHS